MIVTKAMTMTYPGGGIYVVQGEIAILLTAMRRGARWSSHSHQVEILTRLFIAMSFNTNFTVNMTELGARYGVLTLI
jgi:hypothetical protein